MEDLYDHGLALPGRLTMEDLRREEIEHALAARTLAEASLMVPRRLGGEATGDELRADRKLSRQIGHAYDTLLRIKDVTSHPFTMGYNPADHYAEGARVVWSEWIRDRIGAIGRRRVKVWTAGVRLGEPEEAMRLVHHLEWEERELKRVYV